MANSNYLVSFIRSLLLGLIAGIRGFFVALAPPWPERTHAATPLELSGATARTRAYVTRGLTHQRWTAGRYEPGWGNKAAVA